MGQKHASKSDDHDQASISKGDNQTTGESKETDTEAAAAGWETSKRITGNNNVKGHANKTWTKDELASKIKALLAPGERAPSSSGNREELRTEYKRLVKRYMQLKG